MTSMQRFDPFREMHSLRRMMHSPFFMGRGWGDPFEPEGEPAVEPQSTEEIKSSGVLKW